MIVPSKIAKVLLVIFAFAHLVFAACFALKTPYRTPGYVFLTRDPTTHEHSHPNDIGAPDERQHANYIGFLMKQHRLPVLDPASRILGEEYQSHQPPLFYLSAALVATVTGQSNVESHSFGNVVRIFNCLIGVAGICGAFFAALWATKREDVAILATAFAALLPMNCALSGAISNDPLLITLIAWSFAYCARAYSNVDETFTKKYLVAAAIFTGLACITKSSGLVALAGFEVTIFSMRKQIPPKILSSLALLALVIALPLWLRNQFVYGDPLAQKVFKEAFVNSAQKSGIVGQIGMSNAPGSPEVQYWFNWVGYWTARSFIGVFGNMDIWLNESGNPYGKDPNLLYKGLIAFILVAKLGFLVYLRQKWSEVPKPVLTGLLICILTLLLFIGFNLTYFQAQGRYLLIALAPIALILSLGWLYAFRSKLVPALVLVVALFGGTTVYALTRLGPEFESRQTNVVSPR